MTLSSLADAAIICSATLGLLMALIGIIRWMMGHHLDEKLRPINEELSHNGGSSLKDRIYAMQLWQVKIDEHLDNQDRRLERIEHKMEDK